MKSTNSPITKTYKASLLGLALFFCGGAAQATSVCSGSLNAWLNAKANKPAVGSTIRAFSQYQTQVFAAQKESAQALYASYIGGTLDLAALDTCLSLQEDRGDFLNILQTVFYEESIAKLRVSRSASLQRLLVMLDAKNKDGKEALFRLTGYFQEQSPTELKGGFQRATGSIFMDFSRVAPNEWMIIFIHELLHSLDDNLWAGVLAYSQPEKVKLFATWADTTNSFSALATPQQSDLRTWIDAGLDRGLWAEYRAWLPTFQIYRDGVQEGLWRPVDWLEQALHGWDPSARGFDRYLYNFLDSRSEDPVDEIFSRGLIQDALKTEREKYRLGPLLPVKGNLSSIP